MKMEIRPIEVGSWHGKKGKDSFKRPIKISALVDPVRMEYATGLDNVNRIFPNQEGEENKLTEQQYYGEKIRQDLSPQFDSENPHPFWDSSMAIITLPNNTIFLDTDIVLDYIKAKVLKASKFVANSRKEYEEGLFPEATHVIYDEAENVKIKATKVEAKNQAILLSNDLSLDRKIEIVLIVDGKNLKGKSAGMVTVEMDKIIEKDPVGVLRHIQMNAEDITLRALVLECLQKSVLTKSGHKILYMSDVIGGDVDSVVAYLKMNENQNLKLRLMESVNLN